jgi:hypothetical protein
VNAPNGLAEKDVYEKPARNIGQPTATIPERLYSNRFVIGIVASGSGEVTTGKTNVGLTISVNKTFQVPFNLIAVTIPFRSFLIII